jgi:malate dehydrogenase
MSTIAIIGAGPIGSALAQKLALRSRIGRIRLIDPEVKVAEGKALDIEQSSPVESFSSRLSADAHYSAAAGADAIVFADLVATGEIAGEPGLALVKQVIAIASRTPMLFAGGAQRELMTRTITELHAPAGRVAGSAPLALESAVRAVTAALVDATPVDVSLAVAGVPPKDGVIAWDSATAFNQPIARVLAPHHMASLSARLPALWPPSPYTLGSAGARVAEALALGSRRRYTCFAAVGATGIGRNIIAAVPGEFVKGGIGRTFEPALSPHERTQFEKGLR